MNAIQSIPYPKFWRTVLSYGALHYFIMFLGWPLIENTQSGCMFIVPAYFFILAVALPILILQRIGAGAAVYLPYAVLGFPLVYYFDWVETPRLIGPLGAVGWCLIGPLVGLIGDLTFKYFPKPMAGKWRAVVTGATLGAATFVTTLLALSYFYKAGPMEGHLVFFARTWYFSLPWLVVNGGFAGYTAYAIRGYSQS